MRRAGSRTPRLLSVLVVLTATALSVPGAPVQAARATGPCGAPSAHVGGEWPSYGHDLANSRSQPRESTIGPDTVDELQVAWVLDAGADGGGQLNSTPIVADGCLYVAPSSGRVIAVNADTGKVAWTRQMDVSPPGYGGGVVGAPVVAGDSLIVVMNPEGAPYLASLRRSEARSSGRP